MYDYIKGELTNINNPYITIENNGIGYRFLTNSRTISKIGKIGDKICIYSKLIHKEDTMYSCGFLQKQDRIIFDILTSVNGVGVKVAFALLDEFEVNDLVQSVLEENYKLISTTKGVGPKMAQKIVLEIKDKLTKIETTSSLISFNCAKINISNETILQTTTILNSLGYSQNEYQKALELALTKLEKDDSQELLKEALQILSAF